MVFVLVLANVLCYIIDTWGKQTADTDFECQLQGLYLNLRDPRAYQLITANLCHMSTQHLGANMFPLLLYGKAVEKQVGPRGLLLVYFFCGVCAHLVILLSFPVAKGYQGYSIGSSGATFGLLAFAGVSQVLRKQGSWRSLAEALVVGYYVFLHVSACIWLLASLLSRRVGIDATALPHSGAISHLSGAVSGLFLAPLVYFWGLFTNRTRWLE